MQKIKKALEQNRQDRVGMVGSVSSMPGIDGISDELVSPSFQVQTINLDSKRLRKNRIFRGDEQESVTMAYKVLRTQVFQALTKNGWNSVGITSSNKSEGKSLTTLNLAYSLARSVYQTVVLVDFDLRRPSIHHKLGYEPKYGLSDYYINNVPISEIAFNPGIEGLVVVPGRESLQNASELIASLKTRALMKELAQMFPSRISLYDLPPVLLVDDVLAFATNMDATLVVASEGISKKEELIRSLDLLQSNNVLGVVLNKSGESTMGGYYY